MSAVEFGLASQAPLMHRTSESQFERALTSWQPLGARYEALSQLSRAMASSTTEEISGNVAELLQPILECDFASITLFDQNTTNVSAKSLDTTETDNPSQKNSPWSACKEEKPIWISDWQSDADTLAHPQGQSGETGPRWLCRLPLQTSQGCLGVLSVAIDQPARSE